MAYTEQNRGRGVCEVRATGDKGNGGYYDSTIAGAGTDYTQQDAAQITQTDWATDATGTHLSSATFGSNCTSAYIGNAFNLTSGTGLDTGPDATSVYWVTGVGPGNAYFLLDRSAGASATAITGRLGGARASIGGALSNQASGGGTVVYVKGGAYTCTSSTSNIDGGKAVPVAGSATYGPTRVVGYSTTRTDNATGTRPSVTFAYGAAFGDTSAAGTEIANIDVSCSNTASSVGFITGAQSIVTGCKAYQAITGFRGGSGGTFSHCIADACANGFGDGTLSAADCLWCWAKGTVTNYGFRVTSNAHYVGCIASGGANYGFYHDSGGILSNCLAYGNTLSGFYRANATLARPCELISCLSAYNSTYGYEDAGTNPNMRLLSCASVGNTTARSTGVLAAFDTSAVTLSGDPFRARTANDFRLNSRGPGVVCRTTGFMATFPGYSTLPRNVYLGAYPTREAPTVQNWPNAQGWPGAS